MSNQIIERYTQSLFESSIQLDSLKKVHKDLISIKKIIIESPDFMLFVKNPILTNVARSELIKQIFKGHLNELTYTFIELLESKQRLDFLEGIIDSFESKYMIFTNTVKAQITSARKLSEGQIKEITEHLKKKFTKEIIPVCHIDEDVIAGIKIQIDDQIYDYTIQTQLNVFEKTCMGC